MTPEAKMLIPQIPIKDDADTAERRLFENFENLKGLLKDGVSGTLILGTQKLTFVKGVMTKFATAT